jgi:hypothetical protein
MRYVTTDAAALAAAYRRERDLVAGATSETATADTTRRLGWVAPLAGESATVRVPVPSTAALAVGTYRDGAPMYDWDAASGWTFAPAAAYPTLPRVAVGPALARSMPEPRKGTPTRSRKGLVSPSTSTRHAATSEGMAHGAVIAGVGTDAGVLAVARAGRAMAREDAAHAAHAARMDAGAGVCSRPLPVPTVGIWQAWEWVCGCGAGVEVITTVIPPADDPTGALVRDHRHALAVCPAPVETRDAAGSLTGHKCGCGRKRGALTRQRGQWCHRRRV